MYEILGGNLVTSESYFIQQIFTEYLLCPRHLGYHREQSILLEGRVTGSKYAAEKCREGR